MFKTSRLACRVIAATGMPLRRFSTGAAATLLLFSLAACNGSAAPTTESDVRASPSAESRNDTARSPQSLGRPSRTPPLRWRQVKEPPGIVPQAHIRSASGPAIKGQIVYRLWLDDETHEARSIRHDSGLSLDGSSSFDVEIDTSVEPEWIQVLTYKAIGRHGLPTDKGNTESCQRSDSPCVYVVGQRVRVSYTADDAIRLVIINASWFVPEGRAASRAAIASWAFAVEG